MDKTDVIIASAVRTPIGAFQGVLSPATAPQLGAAAIAGAIARGGIAGGGCAGGHHGLRTTRRPGQAPRARPRSAR
jgi:acetyl-CoA C-acetyltransferase